MDFRISVSLLSKKRNYRIQFWIAVFFMLLVGVVLAGFAKQYILLKICGALLVLTFTIVVRVWLSYLNKERLTRPPKRLNINEIVQFERLIPFLNQIPLSEKKTILQRVELILANTLMVDSKFRSLDSEAEFLIGFLIAYISIKEELVFDNLTIIYHNQEEPIILNENKELMAYSINNHVLKLQLLAISSRTSTPKFNDSFSKLS